jgi:hypothetical protein
MTKRKKRFGMPTRHVAMNKNPLAAAGLAAALAGCTASLASSITPLTATITPGAPRELTAQEKTVIVESLSEHIRDPERARYLWAPLQANAPANGKAHYCAAVNAKSPHAPYSGLQPYLVQVQTSNGQVVSSVVGAITGGSDARIVRNLCAKHGLNPDNAA